MPLHTLRADIDYGVAEAKTTYGIIGIKVWVLGDILARNEQPAAGDADTENRRDGVSRAATTIVRANARRRRAGGEQGDADKSGKRVEKAGANDAAAVEKGSIVKQKAVTPAFATAYQGQLRRSTDSRQLVAGVPVPPVRLSLLVVR